MAERKSQDWLVWGVLGLMLLAGVAALALSPGTPGGPGNIGQNRSPVARISPTNASVNLGGSIEFSGANSTDPDGSVHAFAWDFGDGATGTGAIVTHQYDVTGAMRVRLEVTDDKGAKNATTTSVWVNLNQPIAPGVATWNQLTGSLPANVTFPLDPGAVRLVVTLQLNTSNPLGAKGVVSVLDPNGAALALVNQSLSPGTIPGPITITLGQDNLTVEGEWRLKVEAQPAVTGQPSVTIGFTGSIRVEYKP
jgi:phage baseplate assembly protein gpV